VRSEPVDPRLDAEWESDPIVNYRVIFWVGKTRSSEYDLFDADDVHAAIAWADAEAQSRSCTYALYAKVRGSQGAGLVWLAGIDPSAHSRPNFERSQPLG
jgi:hypothetical protein